jgi:WD40 repeat protein
VSDGSRTELDSQTHLDWKGLEFFSLLADTHFLMRDYQTPISLSALQVYHSGVATMPECKLRKESANFHTALLISERDRGWQTGMTILYGHTNSVSSVALSCDGVHIVSGSDDHTVRIWDAVSGTIQHTLEGHRGFVRSVAFSSDGLHIVSGSDDHTARIWDAVSGTVLHTLEGHTSYVFSVAVSSDGLRIVSGSGDQTARIWDTVSGTIQHILEGHTSMVFSVAFSSDGLHIVSGSGDQTVRIWDAVSGTIQHTLEGHTDVVNSVAFSSDGLHIVSGSYDRTVRIWDVNTGVMQHILDEYRAGRSLRVFLSTSTLRDGLYIFITESSLFAYCYHTLIELTIDQNGSGTTSHLDVSEGWVFRIAPDGTRRRMCWLPHKRWHDGKIACWGQKAVIGAASGTVTILDFSNM